MARFVRACQSPHIYLSVLLVADNKNHLKSFAEGLNQSTGGDEDLLRVLTCESIPQFLAAKDTKDVDYIVFCVNQNRFEALSEIERSILKLDQTFLLNRICLICDNKHPSSTMMPRILHLKHKFQLHILWGNLDTEIPMISKRLKNLAAAICGADSGFPIITHRSWHQARNNDAAFSAASDTDLTF